MSPCLTSCCPCRGVPAQAPRQWQHEVRQGDTHDSGLAAIEGVPLPNQQRKFCDGPVRVKAPRLGRQSGSLCENGVSPWCTQPPVTKPHHRNDINPPRNVKGTYPHPPNPPRPSGVTDVGSTTAIGTHNIAGTNVLKGGRPPSNAIGRNQAGCSHSSANTLGPVHHVARTHQTDDKSKGRKRKGVHQQRVLC